MAHAPIDGGMSDSMRVASESWKIFTAKISASGAFSRITAVTAVPWPRRSV